MTDCLKQDEQNTILAQKTPKAKNKTISTNKNSGEKPVVNFS